MSRVVHIAAEEDYAKGLDGKYEADGFMLNIHAPKNLMTGEGKPSAVAVAMVQSLNIRWAGNVSNFV